MFSRAFSSLLAVIATGCLAGTNPTSGDAGVEPVDGANGGEADAAPSSDAGRVPDPERGLSTGCGKTAGTGLQTLDIQVDGETRSFLRFIPASYAANTPMSLVLAFHGSGGTAAGARSTFNLEGAANGKAVLVYPQGLPNAGGENRWDATTKDHKDNKFIDEIIRRTEDAFCIDRDRIFAAGFSNGGRYTACLGCWRGDVLRAIAPVAPGGNNATLPFTGCVGEVGIWEGLGTLDSDHTVGATRVRDHFATVNGCAATRTPTTPTGCERYDGCRAEVPSVWCTYTLGHAWPTLAPLGVMGFFGAFQ